MQLWMAGAVFTTASVTLQPAGIAVQAALSNEVAQFAAVVSELHSSCCTCAEQVAMSWRLQCDAQLQNDCCHS